MDRNKILVEVEHCTKSFPGVIALNDVSFDLIEGEIHCIVGENGAGKSTFIKILSGAYYPDRGSITVNEKKYSKLTPILARENGIQTIYQDIILAENLTVAENIFLGSPIKKGCWVDHREMKNKASAMLRELKIELDVKAEVSSLSIAQKQFVQIVKALAQKAKVLILDEPTAALSRGETIELMTMIRNISQKGVGVIYISHHLEEVFELANRVTILRDGSKISTLKSGEFDRKSIINDMVGRNIESFYKRRKCKIGKDTFVVKGLCRGEVVKNINFHVNSGEIVGIAGMVGAGRTEMVRLIVGADKSDSREVFLKGKKIQANSPNEAIKSGISLITEDRQVTGLALMHSIQWNIFLSELDIKKGIFRNLKREKKVSSNYNKTSLFC